MTQDAWSHDELGWFPAPKPVVADPQSAAATEWLPHHQEPELLAAAAPRSAAAIGIDISSYQGSNINWGQVAATGRSYVMLKATEGTAYISPSLDAQYQGAKAAGLITGLYHFANTANAPESDADAFAVQVNRLNAIAGHMPPCLDLETGTGDLAAWAQRFITRLRAQTGCVRVLIYSNVSFMRNQILTSSWLDANIALWVADWSSPPAQPSLLTPQVAMHQYSSAGVVSGIAGSVDLDICIWSLSTLVPGVAPPPVAVVPPAPVATSPVTSLTVDQVNQILGFLTALYQQGSGSVTLGDWTGWASWPGGSGRSLTPVDYLRQGDVLLNTLVSKVTALSAATAAPAGSLSDADVQRIATAVTTMLAQRMAS